MSVRFHLGLETFELSPEDVQRHPGSLLHSLVGSTQALPGQLQGVEFSEVQLQNSPLITSPAAMPLTMALYKSIDGKLDISALSQLLRSHTVAPCELYDSIKTLLAYLNLPGSVSSWLPPLEQISIRLAGVADLHFVPQVSRVVELILDHVPFHSTSMLGAAWAPRQAVFQLAVRNDVEAEGFEEEDCVLVYVVHGRYQNCTEISGGWAVLEEAVTRFTGGQQPRCQLLPVCKHDTKDIRILDSGLSKDKYRFASQQSAFGGCVTAALQAELSKVPTGCGIHSPVKLVCYNHCDGSSYYNR